MVDPVTVGTLVAGTLSMAAEAALNGVVTESVKDAYNAVKGKLARSAGSEVEALERSPVSAGRRAVVAEIIDNQSSTDQELIRALAQTLLATLKDSSPRIGLDVGRLSAMEVQIGNVKVAGRGIGARFGEVDAKSFSVDSISVARAEPKT